MKGSSNKLLTSLELGGIIFILLFADLFQIPTLLTTLINLVGYGITISLAVSRRHRLAYVATRDLLLIAFVAFAFASLVWTENIDATFTTLRGLFRTFVFAAYFATRFTTKEQIKILSLLVSGVLLINLIVAFVFPNLSYQQYFDGVALKGIFAHKQTLGRYLGIASGILIVSFLMKARNKFLVTLGTLPLLVLLALARSATGILALLFVLGSLPLYKLIKQSAANRTLLIMLAFVLYGALFATVAINLDYILVEIFDKNLEFNGRTPIWTLAIQKGIERPWLGYGFNGFWTSDVSNFVIQNTWAGNSQALKTERVVFHSHNGFIDLFLQFGVIGVAIGIIHLFTLLRRLVNLALLTRKPEHFWMLQMLGVYFLCNLTEGGLILTPNTVLTILYFSISLSSVVELNVVRRAIKQYAFDRTNLAQTELPGLQSQ